MAEAIDLDEWEVLSQSSFSREEFDEEDGFVYEDYLYKDSGEVFDSTKSIQSDCKGDEMINCENNSSCLEGGFDEKDCEFDKERVIGESSVCRNLELEDSVEELGFGETEVLGAFCSDGIINYGKNRLETVQDFGEKDKLVSVLDLQGIDNLNLVRSNEINNEIKDIERSFDSSKLVKKDLKEEERMNSDNLETEENKENEGAKKQICKAQNENKDLIWWKMPRDIIKYYLFGIKPVWSVSFAMGFLGFLMISRKLYKMKKQQDKTIPPIKVRFDEKKRAQVQTRAARLNKGLTNFRPEPIIRNLIPGFGVTIFPTMSSLQYWAP